MIVGAEWNYNHLLFKEEFENYWSYQIACTSNEQNEREREAEIDGEGGKEITDNEWSVKSIP